MTQSRAAAAVPQPVDPSDRSTSRLVVFGASAGGLPVLQRILRGLPADFRGIICVVVHIPPWRKSYLSAALTMGERRAVEPMNHQQLIPGRVYVAPPDHHFIIEEGGAGAALARAEGKLSAACRQRAVSLSCDDLRTAG